MKIGVFFLAFKYMKRGPFSNQGTVIFPPFLVQVRVPGDVHNKYVFMLGTVKTTTYISGKTFKPYLWIPHFEHLVPYRINHYRIKTTTSIFPNQCFL